MYRSTTIKIMERKEMEEDIKRVTKQILGVAELLLLSGGPNSTVAITFDESGGCQLEMGIVLPGMPAPTFTYQVAMFNKAIGLWSNMMMLTYTKEQLFTCKLSLTKGEDGKITTVNTLEVDDILDNI